MTSTRYSQGPFLCQQLRCHQFPSLLLAPFMHYSKLASHAATATSTLRKSLFSHRSLPRRSLATTTTTAISTSVTSPSAPPTSHRLNILPCRYTTLPLRGQHQIRRSSTTRQAKMLLNTNSKKHKVTVIGSGNW